MMIYLTPIVSRLKNPNPEKSKNVHHIYNLQTKPFKECFRTCDVLPFNSTHLALKTQGTCKTKRIREFLQCLSYFTTTVPSLYPPCSCLLVCFKSLLGLFHYRIYTTLVEYKDLAECQASLPSLFDPKMDCKCGCHDGVINCYTNCNCECHYDNVMCYSYNNC